MKKKMNRLSMLFIMAMMVFALSACSFSVGNTSKNDDYEDLFPDKAATLDKSYKTSNVGYKFTVGDGEMMVYVDTSEGHSFELIENPAGFKIKDKDGNDALYAICMERNQYAEYSAICDSVLTVNNRDFLYTVNGDGSEDCYSYMADCGLDYGLVLEVHDNNTENFELVSFRGQALEGASSDVYYYQGKLEYEDVDELIDETELTEDNGDLESINSKSVSKSNVKTSEDGVLSYLDDETIEFLEKIDTDYKKVKWGVSYNLDPEIPGIVVSVTPCVVYNSNQLVVAITNLYDQDFSLSASVKAKDKDDNIVGESYIYNASIGPGNTVINFIDCEENTPDGRISWEDIDINDALYSYIPWTADYGLKGNPKDGYLTANYDFYVKDGQKYYGDFVTVLLLDEEGFVIGAGTDYINEVDGAEKYSGEVSIYGDEAMLALTKDVAIFANPYEQE